MSHDFLFKIIIVGDPNVGKSTIIKRLISDKFDDNYNATIGLDFAAHTFYIDEKEIKIYIWDTAGQECFRSIIKSYYSDIAGAILVYDISDRSTFDNIERWLDDVEKNKTSEEMPSMVLIGNKSDKLREVQFNEAESFAEYHNMLFYETSAHSNENINPFFQDLVDAIYRRKDTFSCGCQVNEKIETPPSPPVSCCKIN